MTSELHRLAGTLMDLSGVTSVRMNVQGVGAIDPFVNWASILQPKPVLEASNVAGWALQAAGRLEGFGLAPRLSPRRTSIQCGCTHWCGLLLNGYGTTATGATRSQLRPRRSRVR